MFNIAICDDEILFAEQISKKIKKYMPDCEIKKFHSGEDLLQYDEMFDIYFLDIQMDSINGIETARRLREHEENSVVVFITGAKEYVFEAFDVAALHYLIKPVDEEKLQEVLKRAAKEILNKRGKENRQIFIKTRNKSVVLNTVDILYFENEMRKIVAHTIKGKVSYYGTMADMEKQAGESFCRCHRGYLVNMSYVVEYDMDSVLLSNGEKLYISKDRYSDFVKQYMRYLRDGGVLDE